MPDYRERVLRPSGGVFGTPAFGFRNDAGGDRAGTDQNLVAVQMSDDGRIRVASETQRPVYEVAITGLVPAASATDLVQIIGSATTIVAIRRIRVSGKAGTAITVPVTLAKRSTANTGGTATTPTPTPLDSADAAATAVASFYTVNPTTGTETGIVGARDVTLNVTTLGGVAGEWDLRDAPIILRGVAQAFAIKANATTVTTGTLNIEIEFDERPLTA